ncbi:MAG: hypothetical protein F083_2891 [bacterium F083]|nr:MAG: hypothetical protein F083_2891 [bacterium F083]
MLVINDPRIGGIDLPIEQAEVASLEGLDDFAARQTAAPVHLNVRAVGIQAVGIVLSDDTANGIEVLIKDVVDRARGLVVDDHDGFTLDRHISGLVTFLGGLAVIGGTSIDVASVVTLSVGREVVGVAHTELVLANHGHGSTSDAGGAVLFVDVTVHIAVARDLHGDRITRGALAFVVHGGDIVGVTFHVVLQRTVGVGGVADVVHLSVTNQFTVTIHVVETIGAVDNSVPVEDDLFVIEHSVVNSGEVGRDVEVSGEAPDRAAHAIRATVVVELDVPEVVGVVPQIAHRIAVSQFGGEAAILRIHDRLWVVGIRVVGATEDQSPTSGIGGDVPTQGHAAGFNLVGVVGRSRVEGKAFGLDIRARHVFGVDGDLEVSIGRRGNQVVGTSLNGGVDDLRTIGHFASRSRFRTRSRSGRNIQFDVVNSGAVAVAIIALEGNVICAIQAAQVDSGRRPAVTGLILERSVSPGASGASAVNNREVVIVT